MVLTFTDLVWRSSDDSDTLNLHAIESIRFSGDERSGIVTIQCTAGVFTSPYYRLSFGGGLPHFECTIRRPYELDRFCNLVIFDNGRVCLNYTSGYGLPKWFTDYCHRYTENL